MPSSVPQSGALPAEHSLPPGILLTRATPARFHAIARRLVSQANADVDDAARRLMGAAGGMGIDLSLAWATTAKGSDRIRQACLAVPGMGRTAMLFLSEPLRAGEPDGPETAQRERAALASAACETLIQEFPGRVVLAQCLPDPDETWASRALTQAGFTSVGELHYLRRAPGRLPPVEPGWPDGITVAPVGGIHESRRNDLLIRAMDATYEQTLDCPELCGLRETADILASHKSTGIFDPSLWWLVLRDQTPLGCLLMSLCPPQRSTELVYVGLAPALRGLGLGRRLLAFGLSACQGIEPSWPIACAVDARNAPALALYDALGFRRFARRVALVRPLNRRVDKRPPASGDPRRA